MLGRSRHLPGSMFPSSLAQPRLGFPRCTEFTARLTPDHFIPLPQSQTVFPVVLSTVCPSGVEILLTPCRTKQEEELCIVAFLRAERSGDPGSQPISALSLLCTKGDWSSCLSGL